MKNNRIYFYQTVIDEVVAPIGAFEKPDNWSINED